MVLMRQSNIELRADPQLARQLGTMAAELAEPLTPQRLHASIARQLALAAAVCGDACDFDRRASWGREVAQAAPVEDDLALYANCSYVAADVAQGLLILHCAEEAVATLSPHVEYWPDGQRCDQTVGRLRLSRALAVTGDYEPALHHVRVAAGNYLGSPNARAQRELRVLHRLAIDRQRTNRSTALADLRRCVDELLQGRWADA
jgi:hypothetical protein